MHDRTDAQAITGGAVYRGSALPGLVGFYVYGDFNSQKFFAFHIERHVAPCSSASRRRTWPPSARAATARSTS